MIPRAYEAVKSKAARSAVFKVTATTAIRSAPKKGAPPPLSKITPVFKGIMQIMPRRSATLSTMKKGAMNSIASGAFREAIKTARPSIRSAISTRIAPKKLSIINPTKKTLGYHNELTSRSLRKLMGYMGKFGMIYQEFAGASQGISPSAVLRGGATGMSVPVDRLLEEPAKSTKLLVTGIPVWLEHVKVYYDLLVYLSKYHLILTHLDFTSQADEGRAAWISVNLDYEAEQLLEAAGYQLKFSAHHVFSIPESIRLTPDTLIISMVENATLLKPQVDRLIINSLTQLE